MDRSSDYCGFLDSGTSLTGELQFAGTLRIDGDIRGSIKTSDTLIVGKKGTVDGDISAGEVQLFGTVLGNIDCERRLQICSGGHLCGDVRTSRLIIEEGGRFEGLSQLSDSVLDEPVSKPEPDLEIEEEPSSVGFGRSVLPPTDRWAHLGQSFTKYLAEVTTRTLSALNWQRP